jgi:hypothetical protein
MDAKNRLIKTDTLAFKPHSQPAQTRVARLKEYDARTIKSRLDRLEGAGARVGRAALNVLDAYF